MSSSNGSTALDDPELQCTPPAKYRLRSEEKGATEAARVMVVSETEEIEVHVGVGQALPLAFRRPVGPRSEEARESTIQILLEETERERQRLGVGACEIDDLSIEGKAEALPYILSGRDWD